MEKRWVLNQVPSPANIRKLETELGINSVLTTLLFQRGINSFKEAKTFFRPSIDQLHDPFLMKDMEKAVNRLCEAISDSEKILIYGDYDVDGTTSVSLVYQFLSSFSDQLAYYIPDRYSEGYGISKQGIQYAKTHNFSLIISLDCGIRALEMALLAKSHEIDLIICDHHLPGTELPDAYAILDPKQPNCNYPFKELSGCGVGFKLLQGFCLQNSIPVKKLYQFLDLVAVSIASDIVPIVGENRILAFYGLKKLNHSPSAGLKSLIEISGITGQVDISSVVFYLGPRINAAGRLTHAHESVKLLTAKDENETSAFAQILNKQNTERKDFDRSITDEALEMIRENKAYEDAKSTVLFKESWHKGVIGIVASRCIESFYRPTIILTASGDKATGSARSVEGFDIHEAIGSCSELLDQYGGHAYAAGLTMPVSNVSAFREKFEAVVTATFPQEFTTPKLEIDLNVDFSFINHRNFSILSQMAPFGPKNPKPTFAASKVKLKFPPKIIKEEHLKLTLFQDGIPQQFEAIAFGMAKEYASSLQESPGFQIAFQIDENNYRGNKSLQLNIKDIKID